ncbi:hypothetical protein FB451DRAFT_1181992 [Mycena latifolia]|nr:hypothetical protein FB451DRAFT_1181992 [Mycena latifolia]
MYLMYRSTSFADDLTEETRKALDRIQSLEVRVLTFFFADLPQIASWVVVFRRVQHVDITLVNSSPTELSADMRRIVQVIKPTELLDTISVNGKAYKLVDG